MAGERRPLTKYQLKILAAVGAAGESRALEIAIRAGVATDGLYTDLSRLAKRGLVSKVGAPARYALTDEGRRQLEASKAYQERLREAS